MAGVREVFEIVDRATRPLRNIGNQMERVTQTAKSLGTQVEETTQKVNVMHGAFTRVFAGLATLATVKKALDLSDELTLTSARLANVNDGLQTTEELQERIYQAALRSRGSYLGMMQTVASLKAQTGDTFSSVQEAVNFTELLQKQFKIAGTDATGIASTMYNLTQALSTGVLRGQDLNIVMSNAPQIAQRIARYMGLTVGQLKEVASRGQVTSDVVKAAMLGAADDINAQFEKMPMTFGDAMQKLKNMGVRAFQPLGTMISEAVNAPQTEGIIDGIGQAFYVVAAFIGQAIYSIADGMSIFGGVIDFVAQRFGGMGQIAVAVIGTIDGLIVGAAAVIYNVFAGIANVFIVLVQTLQNNWAMFVYDALTKISNFAAGAVGAFAGVVRGAENAANAIATAFVNGANIAIGGINKLIEAINHIPGVNIGQVSTLAAPQAIHTASDQIEALSKSLAEFTPDSPTLRAYKQFSYADVGQSFANGKNLGSEWMQGVLDGMGKQTNAGAYGGLPGGVGAGNTELMPNGGNVGKVGKVGKVDEVKLSDEDLKIYRDLAERRYMNNIELKTLAPEINVTLPAGASGNLSAQDVADKLKRMLIEQMAAQTSVAHA